MVVLSGVRTLDTYALAYVVSCWYTRLGRSLFCLSFCLIPAAPFGCVCFPDLVTEDLVEASRISLVHLLLLSYTVILVSFVYRL